MDKLFLDANVLFTAAHNAVGKAAFLFDHAGAKRWKLLSSAFAIEEARRNIAAKYPHCLSRLEQLMVLLTKGPQPQAMATPIALPEKDQPVFLSARSAGATHLLTGDLKHFGPYMNKPGKSGGLLIQTVADYIAGL